MNFLTSAHPFVAFASVFLAIAWNAFLFWPEIRNLRVVYPERARTESPVWLYVFALAALGIVIAASFKLYWANRDLPHHLTDTEFAESYIEGKRLFITDLADADNVVERRTFENCWIYGPAVIFGMGGTDIRESTIRTPASGAFLVAESGQAGPGTGVIVLRDCKFRHCVFVNITIAGNEAMIEQYKELNTGAGTYHPKERAPGTP